MDEERTLLPISGIVINQLEIDTVDEEGLCGVCLTPQDIQHGYQRWKTMLGSPDPLNHEYTDPAIGALHQHGMDAESEIVKCTEQIETAQARNLKLVGDVADREKDIRALEAAKTELENDKSTLQRLAESRATEIRNLNKTVNRLTKQVNRYLARYRSADQHLNLVQRFISWLFRI